MGRAGGGRIDAGDNGKIRSVDDVDVLRDGICSLCCVFSSIGMLSLELCVWCVLSFW